VLQVPHYVVVVVLGCYFSAVLAIMGKVMGYSGDNLGIKLVSESLSFSNFTISSFTGGPKILSQT
jgi:hypothetical protein